MVGILWWLYPGIHPTERMYLKPASSTLPVEDPSGEIPTSSAEPDAGPDIDNARSLATTP